ncbi:ISL3 family transposase [Streptomyces sp. CG1]|uniref:ISL3 family transposase n=1 Tax=Streptomyces sp. CG1 TaxID=1287523 RepID=UPI0034E2B0C2
MEQVVVESGGLRVTARTRDDSSLPCPDCGTTSGRVHSRHQRHLADAAVGGRPVVIELTVRRLFCDTRECRRRTFAEQVDGMTIRYGRYTSLLLGMSQAVGLALAGSAGARLLRMLNVVVSRVTLLSLVLALPEPVVECPRILGVDEFALKRSHRYGTLLVDVESHRVVDVLDDYIGDTLAAWLQSHPGAEAICRDRGSSFGDGARRGAPRAQQCADRYHVAEPGQSRGTSQPAGCAPSGCRPSGNRPPRPRCAPSRRFLYACYSLEDGETGRVGAVDAFAIDPGTGTLDFLNRVSLHDSGCAHLAVAPDGRHVVVANYYGGAYVVLPVGEDGRLGPVSGTLQNTGSGPHPRQDSAHPHAVVFDPGGRFLTTADLGIDQVRILRLTDGRLEPVSRAPLPPGTGPRHLAFTDDASTLHVIGELDATITVFAYDATTGTVQEILQTVATAPPGYPGPPSGAEIAVHPSGDFRYASNRGSQTITGYRIDRPTGTLSAVGHTGQGVSGPTNFVIDPGGRPLYVNNSTADNIAQFAVDPETGELEPTGRTTSVPVPLMMALCSQD